MELLSASYNPVKFSSSNTTGDDRTSVHLTLPSVGPLCKLGIAVAQDHLVVDIVMMARRADALGCVEHVSSFRLYKSSVKEGVIDLIYVPRYDGAGQMQRL